MYALCLLGATSTHVRALAMHGLFWDYGGVLLITRIYWTSLTFLDPFAAVLLFLKPRAGLLVTLAIIVSDVAHNTWLLQRSQSPDWLNWMYLSQVHFLVFVILSIQYAWRGVTPARLPINALQATCEDARA
jgi:hypothetical protein